MHNRDKANILGCNVDLLSGSQVLGKIEELIALGQPSHIITLNAEIVYQAQTNIELKELINQAELVTPDGIGIVWGGRRLGYNIQERITGIDLMYQICHAAPNKEWKLYLLGSAPGVAESAAAELTNAYPGLSIVGFQHGYFQEEDIPRIIDNIRGASPQILMVSLGAPKQELFINKYKERLNVPVMIGVGGSLDVIAGQKKRAPEWMIKLNVEWLYRLLSEPSRFRRQLALPKFVALILRSKRSHEFDQ